MKTKQTDEALAELVQVSRLVGEDGSLVLGGSGNTSVKTPDGKFMYIKASGVALKDMTVSSGWRKLAVKPVLDILDDKALAALDAERRQLRVTNRLISAACDPFDKGIRPSMESCFHALLGRCVIHLHPVAVLAYACARDGRKVLEELLAGHSISWAWVPYADPGYGLARKIKKVVAVYRDRNDMYPMVLVLQNHGCVVSANRAGTAVRLVRRLVKLCASRLKQPRAERKIPVAAGDDVTAIADCLGRIVTECTGRQVAVRYFNDRFVNAFMPLENARRLCTRSAITPDELIYCGGPPMWFEQWNRRTVTARLRRRFVATSVLPAGFLVKPYGLFVVGPKDKLPLIKEVISASIAIRSYAAQMGGIKPLDKREQAYIIRLVEKSGTA